MVHGYHDYGLYASKATVAGLTDMAELAARLGSIVTYDRKGDVILLDDYEATTAHFRDSSIPLATAALDTTVALSGAQCVKFTTPAVSDRYAEISYVIPPCYISKHGIKVSISTYELSSLEGYYQIFALFYDGTNSHTLSIRITPKEYKVELYTPTGYVTCISNLFIDTSLPTWWHNVKLVYDLDTGYYTRLLIDALSYDLSTYKYVKTADTTTTLFEVYFTLYPTNDNALVCYQEDFVYTINEP